MAKLARRIRKDIIEWDGHEFNGSFPPGCQETAIPTSLRALVTMLLNGPNVQDQQESVPQASLTISQLILFNMKTQNNKATKLRHSRNREPPLPLYLGLSIHTQTRSKKIVNNLHKLGMSISYNRVMEIEDLLAAAVCEQFTEQGVVCPTNLRKGLFTVGALDNIDHNPSSATAQGFFHGTGISIFQFPTTEKSGTPLEQIVIKKENPQIQHSLPEDYTIVQALAFKTNEISVLERTMTDVQGHIDEGRCKELQWAEHSLQLLKKENLEKGDFVMWSAYHASHQPPLANPPALTALLPLLNDKAASLAMVKHGMGIQQKVTSFLNPQQVPVMAFDQPLFTLAKYIQWRFPDTHGEDKFVVMFGGLHIEMALWHTIGEFLEGSGWTNALCEAGVATSGTADSFLKASHLTKTRHSHQVTLLALTQLQEDAWHQNVTSNEDISFDVWKDDMIKKSPTFQFWNIVAEYERLVMMFIHAHRIQDFSLYVECLEALVPWFFALDRTNYSRWVPIHIRDMKELPDRIREDLKKFWVLQKTENVFSSMPLDQGHEQNNELVKGTGGAVGLTENPTAFRRWMVAGPEQARIINEFESECIDQHNSNKHQQHEQGLSYQETFKKQVQRLCATIKSMGNPFLDDCAELLALDTRNCTTEAVITTVRTIKEIGEEQYKKYKADVIQVRRVPISQPIKKNGLPLFKKPQAKTATKSKQQLESLKSDCNLFGQLYVASKYRDGDLDGFFAHENHPWPPALSNQGKLNLPAQKSDLLDLLDYGSETQAPGYVHAKIFDGSAIVHALPTHHVSTFGEFGSKVFIPWIHHQLENCERVDIVWDSYQDESLKESCRAKRGKGIRRKVSENTKLPASFQDFLRDPVNKQELFALLTDKVASQEYTPEKEVYITSGQSVLSKGTDIPMQQCNHEEADSRMCVHMKDALDKGARSLLIRTVDTDVITILVGVFYNIKPTYPDMEIWVAFGMGKNFCHININMICENLGAVKSLALPSFHSFTGCDTTSQFYGKGKKSAWEAWKSFPQVSEAFISMLARPFEPFELSSPKFLLLERYTCVLYDKTTHLEAVNELRKELFSRKSLSMEKIPPTQASLLQHSRRAQYQAAVWSTCLQSQQHLPSPEGFGWTKADNAWKPKWTLLPEASRACRELLRCGCKAQPLCTRKCKCRDAGLSCTGLCHCRGLCDHST